MSVLNRNSHIMKLCEELQASSIVFWSASFSIGRCRATLPKPAAVVSAGQIHKPATKPDSKHPTQLHLQALRIPKREASLMPHFALDMIESRQYIRACSLAVVMNSAMVSWCSSDGVLVSFLVVVVVLMKCKSQNLIRIKKV